MKSISLALMTLLLLAGSIAGAAPADPKAELLAADTAFSAASAKGGVLAAFLEVATPAAKVLGEEAQGFEGVKAAFGGASVTSRLTWAPSFADVAASGDLGYTWGRYEYAESGKIVERGTYVTVWRRQANGGWKVVLDGGTPDPKEKKG